MYSLKVDRTRASFVNLCLCIHILLRTCMCALTWVHDTNKTCGSTRRKHCSVALHKTPHGAFISIWVFFHPLIPGLKVRPTLLCALSNWAITTWLHGGIHVSPSFPPFLSPPPSTPAGLRRHAQRLQSCRRTWAPCWAGWTKRRASWPSLCSPQSHSTSETLWAKSRYHQHTTQQLQWATELRVCVCLWV